MNWVVNGQPLNEDVLESILEPRGLIVKDVSVGVKDNRIVCNIHAILSRNREFVSADEFGAYRDTVFAALQEQYSGVEFFIDIHYLTPPPRFIDG